jgi:tetratricopeptide (TPR) repeat protein/thioredoxin-related protein
MRNIIKMILLLLFVSGIANAADSNTLEKASGAVVTNSKTMYGKLPNESLIKPLFNKYVVNEMIDIRPLEGHHFNLKANNNCNLTKPETLKPEFMQCQFKEAGAYKINAYICDDKESFCKFEKLDVLVSAPRGYKEALKKRVSSNILYVPKSELKAPPDFIKNHDQFAIDLARKNNQPLLIVFAAQWCPSCNMLDENVFQNKEFQKETKDIVKLILDVDSDISWDLKEKYKVGGYPTTVLTTSTLNEIGRFVGYRTPKAAIQWIKNQVAQKDNPIEFIASKIQNGAALDKDKLRFAQWQLDRDEPENAKITLLNQSSPEAKRLSLIADFKIYEKDKKDKEAAKVLVQLLDQYPKDVLVSEWAVNLSEKDPEVLKKRMDKVKDNVTTWVNGTEVDMSEFLRAELLYNLGEAYENLGDASSAKQAYSNCADEYKKTSDLSTLKTPRGAQMERGFCLAKAGLNQEALNVFESLVKVYKTEFAFNYYYARTLFETGNVEKAYPFAKAAYDGSYGDNMLRAAALKAQIEIEQKNLTLAETTVTKTLDKVYLPTTTQIRSHRYVANLKGVLAKIQTQKEALKTQREDKEKKVE